MNWDQFVNKVLILCQQNWELSLHEYIEEMQALRRAYYKGTGGDKVEAELRSRQVSVIRLDAMPPNFSCSVEKMKERLIKAKAIDKSEVEKEMIEEAKEEERQAQLRREPKHDKKTSTAIVKTQHQKLMERLNAGDLISEKGLAFSLLESGLRLEKDEIDMDYKTWWIGDCVARTVLDGYGIPSTEEERKAYFTNQEDLKCMEEYLAKLKDSDPKTYADLVPHVMLSSHDFKRLTGHDRIPNREWHEMVKRFVGTPIERRSKRKVGTDGDTWIEFITIDNICKVNGVETGRLSTRNKQPEYAYKFIFDRASSIDFLNSIVLGLFDCRPPSYYWLKGGSQLILRALGWTDTPSRLNLEQLSRIAKVTDSNITRRQIWIESYLNELKRTGYIRDWKKDTKKECLERKKEV